MKPNEIVDKGFDQFSKGTLGNSGNNIYVSAKGIIQRIHCFDINGDGYIDLPFANSHDDDNRVPVYVYLDPLNSDDKIELPTDGAFAGAVSDLNGNGYDDLVIANQYDGVSNEVYAMIYYGCAEGMSEKYVQKLWVPLASDVVIGDFNGDKRKDIAFLSQGKIRIFYQSPQGFMTSDFVEIESELELDSFAVDDLDGDGFDDLVVRFKDAAVKVFWGSKDGISIQNATEIDKKFTGIGNVGTRLDAAASGSNSELSVFDLSKSYRLKTVRLNEKPHIFIVKKDCVYFISVQKDRGFTESLMLKCNDVT